MTAYEQRHWLEFVRKAADLPLGYTVSDLRLFHATALVQFPVIAPLIEACIDMLQSTDKRPSAASEKESQPKRSKVDKLANDPILDFFLDEQVFPKNADLVRFAREKLPEMRELRFDKMGRAAIAKSVVAALRQTQPEVLSSLIAELPQQPSSANSDQARDPSFFSKWERVIKGL